MRKKINKKAKHIITCGMIAALPLVSNISVSSAYSSVESEFSTLINRYNIEDVIVENGISIREGEVLDLSKYPGWEMSNDDTVDIDENEILTARDEGTVFLSNEINEKVHIVEIYVSDKSTSEKSSLTNKNVDRDYYKVFIDAGHGGSDPGKTSFGYREDEINLKISKLVEKKLNEKDIKIEVMMSRTEDDQFLPLEERAEKANKYGADVFVSIHNNGFTSSSANGIETYHHTDKTSHKPLANEVQTNAIKETGARDRGVKSANFVVLRETTMPSALFEGGFMTNPAEMQNLANPVYQDKLATAIANGVENYLVEHVNLGTETPDDLPVINTGEVTASSLNVRSGYGIDYGIIGSLSQGAKVEIVETKNGWYKIKYNSGYGYVSGAYINIDATNKLTQNQQNVVEAFKNLYIYNLDNTIIDLSDSDNLIKSYSQATNILRKEENGEKYPRQKFLDAWSKMSSEEKSHPDMQIIQKEYNKIMSITEAAQASLKFYEDVVENAHNIIYNSKIAKDLYDKDNMTLGARGKVYKEYNEATKHGENSKNSLRMDYINDKYLETLNFLEVCINISEFKVTEAKVEANKIKNSFLREVAFNHINKYEGKNYTTAQKNVISMFEQFYIYGEATNPILNLYSKHEVIKKSSHATNILKKEEDGKKYDRQKFLDAWSKMSSKEKSHIDMQEIMKEYKKIISITEAAQACLEFYENVLSNANSLMKNPKEAAKLYDKGNMVLGARGKAYKEYNEATKHGENSKNSSRMNYINEKYLDTLNFLEVVKYSSENNYSAAKIEAEKIKDSALKSKAMEYIK